MAEATVEILIRAQENVSQAVNEVKQQLEGLTQHAQTVFGRLTQFFQQNEAALNSLAKIGAVVSGTITALAVVGARHANQLREEALQIGTIVEKYSVYRAMLEDLEIHAEMLPFFIMRMQVAFQQAAAAVAEKGNKVSQLTALMAALGQTIQSQTNDPLEQFVLLLKEVAKIPDQAQQAAIMFDLFGRRAYTLLPILREGAQELDNLIQKYRELGVTVSDETANKIDRMKDALSTLGASLKAHFSDRVADIAPTIEKIAEALAKLNAKIKEFGEQHPTLSKLVSHILMLVVALGMLLATLGALGNAFKWFGDGLKVLASIKILDWLKNLAGGLSKLWDIIKVIGAGIAGVVNPILLAIGAIVLGLGYAIRKIDEKTGKISDWLAKLMLPKEMRHLVDEGARDRKEAEEWLRRQEEKRRQEEERKKQEKKQEEKDFLSQFRKLLEEFFGESKEKDKTRPDKKGERDEWALWREQMLQSQRNIEQRWDNFLDRLEKQRQEWIEFQKKQSEEMKKKYDELIDKQKEAYDRVARAEEEMRRRMADAYESAARLAANLAARAGVYMIRFGSFGYFAIPVVEEARPVGYRPSRDELMLSFTFYIYYYAQQIWLSLQQIIYLLHILVGHFSFLASRQREQIETERENRAIWRHLTNVAQVFSAPEAIKTRFLSRKPEETPIETPQLPAVAVYLEGIYWSMQTAVSLLQSILTQLSAIATMIAKNSGAPNLNINVPFGYDQIRNAIADAVNEALGNQLAYELVRNA
jgi:hypothetical protein